MPILGKKSYFFTGEIKSHSRKPTWAPCSHWFLVGHWTKCESFGTNITENHLDNLTVLFFGQALDQMGQKCQFWAKFGCFWDQNPIFWGQGVKIFVPSYRESNETPFSR